MNQPINWRDELTDEERAIIERGDLAKEAWIRENMPRAGIINRAIQRARYKARRTPPPKETPNANP